MIITLRDHDGVSILEISGDLHYSNWHELTNKAKQLAELGHTSVIISWEHVRFIDSSAFGALLAVHRMFVEKANGKAVIYTPHEDHQMILEQMQFQTILEIQTSMDAAIKSVRQSSDESKQTISSGKLKR